VRLPMQAPGIKTRLALRPNTSTAQKKRPTLSDNKLLISTTANEATPFSVERVFFLLRWLIIGVAFVIQLYTSNSPQTFARAVMLTALTAAYSGIFLGLRYYVRDKDSRAWLAVLDVALTSLVAGMGGGIYSPFLVLAYLIVVEASTYFNSGNGLAFTALAGVMYMAAALFLPGSPWTELSITIVMTEVMAMFIFHSIGSTMMKAIEQQRTIARHEQELASQLNRQVVALSALNKLSEKLNASLDIDELMQSTVDTLPSAFGGDACVAFLAKPKSPGGWDIDRFWYATDEAYEPSDLPEIAGYVRAGTLYLEQNDLVTLLEEGKPLSLSDESNGKEVVQLVPLGDSEAEKGALAIIRQHGPRFSQTERDLLMTLGRQLALLVRNARLYEMERQNVARLQELEQMKSDFLSVVSHELRTPLTSIKASTLLMLSQPEDELSGTETQLLKNIDRNTERLSGLVSDLLDMAKLQNGRLKLSVQNISLPDVINEAVAAIKPLTDGKQQEIEVSLPNTTANIIGDKRRVEQVVTNLLSNAHRYTPKQSRILVDLADKGDSYQVRVKDNGQGIAEEEKELIFERFYRAPRQNSKNGTGLGLAIAKSLVELHGGRIWVDSKPGEGATFSFTLPK
jgi:signal transduction histidine kinase